MKLKLKTGERYVLRDGRVTSPLRVEPEPIANQPWAAEVDGVIRNWSSDGRWAPPYELGLDLVKPFTDKRPAARRKR